MADDVFFGEAEWLDVLRRLSEELRDGPPVRIIVIGGVAFLLAFNSRRPTQDLDVVLDPVDAPRVISAAERIASEFGLPSGWLNERAHSAGLLPSQVSSDVCDLLKIGGLELVRPADEQLLAMKLMAYRGSPDRDDAMFCSDG